MNYSKVALSQIDHCYPPQVRILNYPYLNTLLYRLSSKSSYGGEINSLVENLYDQFLGLIFSAMLPTHYQQTPTRMHTSQSPAILNSEIINSQVPMTLVSLARAGIIPSLVAYKKLLQIMAPELVRQDHFSMNRKTNEKQEVIGVDVSSSKLGPAMNEGMVMVADPMGATGSSTDYVFSHYKQHMDLEGKLQYVAVHLIVTPEYLKRITAAHPDVHIFALRLDRGLSAPEVLKTPPGTYWDREQGLNSQGYIVPGAGGLGEILNNVYV